MRADPNCLRALAPGLLVSLAIVARAAPPGGMVRVLYPGGATWQGWSDSAQPAPMRELPDSLRLRIEAGDEDLLKQELPNTGWRYVHAACDSVGLMLPVASDGSGRHLSPSGWVRHYWIAGCLVAMRELEVDGECRLQVVPTWRPSPSPSYCEER